MDIQSKIMKTLKIQQPEWFEGAWQLLHIQEFTYRFKAGTNSLFIKWIPENDLYGLNEIKINQTWLPDTDLPTPQLTNKI